MTQNAASEKMINLNAEISAEKTMTGLVFEIYSNDIHMEMALIDRDITVLF